MKRAEVLQEPLKTKPFPKKEQTDQRKKKCEASGTKSCGRRSRARRKSERETNSEDQMEQKEMMKEADSGLESSVSSLSSCFILQERK